MFYIETRGRFGKWFRNSWTGYRFVREAVDAANTEIADGFETIETVRIVDASGRVIDPVCESDLWYTEAGDLMEGPCPEPLRRAAS